MPTILKIDYEALGAFTAIAGLMVTIGILFLSKLLNDKKDSAVNEIKIKHLEERADKVEKRMDKFEEWYNRGSNN